MTTFTITPDAPFSLAAAADFGFGPNTSRPEPAAGEMRLAFVTDDLHGHAAVHLTQRDDETIDGAIAGDADPAAVRRQVCRVLCLDHPGPEWLAVGRRDAVISELQADHPGFRPVLFHSPYEAAAWSVISARRRRTQAAVILHRTSRTPSISATPATIAGAVAPSSSMSIATERRSPSCSISSETTRPPCRSTASRSGAGLPPAGISTSRRSTSARYWRITR